MKLTVCGRNGGQYRDKEFAEKIEKMALFFGRLLKLHRTDLTLTIKIYSKEVTNFDGYAYCEYDVRDKHALIGIPRGEKMKNIITYLAHEMTHAKQYHGGRLRDCEDGTYWSYSFRKNPGLRRWEPKQVASNDSASALKKAELHYSPWEIEAYISAEVLYQAWMSYGKKQ